MDLYCVKCGEPWELLYITDEAEYLGYENPRAAHRAFAEKGCAAIGGKCNERGSSHEVRGLDVRDAQSALYDILGDDVDGAAAMMEDFGF